MTMSVFKVYDNTLRGPELELRDHKLKHEADHAIVDAALYAETSEIEEFNDLVIARMSRSWPITGMTIFRNFLPNDLVVPSGQLKATYVPSRGLWPFVNTNSAGMAKCAGGVGMSRHP